MKYTTEQIEAVRNAIGGHPGEVIRQLLTQRAELLEALKKISEMTSYPMASKIALQAITNTEATK